MKGSNLINRGLLSSVMHGVFMDEEGLVLSDSRQEIFEATSSIHSTDDMIMEFDINIDNFSTASFKVSTVLLDYESRNKPLQNLGPMVTLQKVEHEAYRSEHRLFVA